MDGIGDDGMLNFNLFKNIVFIITQKNMAE